MLVALTDRDDTLVTTNPAPGTRTLIALTGLLRRHNLVLLEYIAHPPSGSHPRDLVRRLAFISLRRVLMPRAVIAAQVLTEAERTQCSESHRAAVDTFHYVPWPTRSSATAALPPRTGASDRVLASGRRTDWDTFFAAADGTGWAVTAVRTAQDADHVRALAAPSGAAVRVDISAVEHDDEVAAATVYVVPLPETGASIGQIRIMNAADAGVPLVISHVRGVQDYVDDTCAVLVPPGDAPALCRAVDALLADPERRDWLRAELFARGGERTMTDYLNELSDLILTLATRRERSR